MRAALDALGAGDDRRAGPDVRRERDRGRAQVLRRHGEQHRGGRFHVRDGAGRRDAFVEPDAGQARVLARRGQLRHHRGVARPQRHVASGARRAVGKRRAPCAGSDHRDALEDVTKLFLRVSAHSSPSSGQRARGATSSVSVMPRASRSAPAHAIIAPLSVQSSGGGATSTVRLLGCHAAKRAADRLVHRDAARDDQRGRPAEALAKDAQAHAQPVADDIDDRLLERRAQVRDVLVAQAARPSRPPCAARSSTPRARSRLRRGRASGAAG